MAIDLIIFIVLILLVGFILFKIVKTLIKAIFIEVILIGLVVILVGFLLFIDLSDFRENFLTSEKLFLYDDDGQLKSGFEISVFTDEGTLFSIPKNQVLYYDSLYQQDDLKTIRGDYYKVLILKRAAFDDVEGPISLENQEFTKDFLLEIVESEDPLDFLADNQLPENTPPMMVDEYKESLGDPDMLKAKILAIMFSKGMTQHGPNFLIGQFKEGNIIFYPKSPIIRAMKYIPNFINKRLAPEIG